MMSFDKKMIKETKHWDKVIKKRNRMLNVIGTMDSKDPLFEEIYRLLKNNKMI